jgi:hypothetical protein
MLLKGFLSNTSSNVQTTSLRLVLYITEWASLPYFQYFSITSFCLVIHGVYCKDIAPNMVSCVSVTTYFYIYLAGNLIWTVLLGESDSTSISWLHQQSPTTTPISRERSTTCR